MAEAELAPPFASAAVAVASLTAVCFVIMTLLKRKFPRDFLGVLDICVMDSSSEDSSSDDSSSDDSSSDDEYFEPDPPNHVQETNEPTATAHGADSLQEYLFKDDGSLAIPIRAIVVVTLFTILVFLVPTVDCSPMKAGYVLHCGNGCKSTMLAAGGVPSSNCCYILTDNKFYGGVSVNGVVTSMTTLANSPVIKEMRPETPELKTKTTDSSNNFEQQDTSILKKEQENGALETTSIGKTLGTSSESSPLDRNKSICLEKDNSENQYFILNISKIISPAVEEIYALLLSYKFILIIVLSSFLLSILIVIASRYNKFVYKAIHDEEL